MTDATKKSLIQSGFFTGIILALFLILSLFTVLSRSNWERGLRSAVEDVFTDDDFRVGDMVKIDSAFSVSGAVFELDSNKTRSKNYALILRITGYYGPLPAVFIYQDGKVSFKGIAYFKNSVSREFDKNEFDAQISYWTARAKDIIELAAKAEAKK